MKLTLPRISEEHAYNMGYDCAINGADDINCHFSIFSTTENTKAWANGKKDGENEKNRYCRNQTKK